MIIKKIIDLCKKRGICCLYDGGEVQYISDGIALYPMYNLPKFDETSLCKTYDITETQRSKIHFSHDPIPPARFNLEDNVKSETVCQRGPMVLSIAGGGAVPYITSQGLMFINYKHLAPLQDVEANMLEVYERINQAGQTYFAIKSGLILLAIVLPYEIINQKLVDDLNSLTNMCKVALDNQKCENIEEIKQVTFAFNSKKDETQE